ncbi:3,4-dihydroxy-2-butanone 4-phosphate synthase [Elsinoe australis]|uniref:3,4-dihydroxy-2-butanone 4-phosphate synthase n=1 Tax=Elsinoe australis TaxID=40998 RepID=A0A4U7ANX9_9PEZI|nr:3,4-dihydroxy-2-butanone 4-phosphate synthase [Elsinoe australis]
MSPSALTNGNTSPALPSGASFSPIPTAIESYRRGDFIIVLDSPSRENEGDLIILASALTPKKCAFLIHHTSGYLCAPMPSSRADALDLPPMLPETANADPNRTAYTITVDATDGVTTGISARDRSVTCRLLGDKRTTKEMLRRPGHVVPLRAKKGGVRERQGHTEAAVEFARLAGLAEEEQVGVIAELVEGDEEERTAERGGTGMMRRDECLAFGKRFGIPVVTIEDLVRWLGEEEGR